MFRPNRIIQDTCAGLCVLLLAASQIHAALIDARWIGGTGNWNSGPNWSNGVAPNNGADTFNVLIDDGSPTASVVTQNMTATIDNLTVDCNDTLSIANTITLTINAGVINNAGSINVSSTAQTTNFRAAGGDVTITGGGFINLSAFPANRMLGLSSGDRFINVDNTIRGSGTIGANFSSFTNQGLVIANQSPSLVIDPPSNGDFTNTGTVRADGGTLRLEHGPFNNTGGLIEALDGSVVELAATTIDGGTLQTSGTGVVRNVGSSAVDGGTNTVINSGVLEVGNATSLFIAGTIQNEGVLRVASTAQTTNLRPANGDTFLTGGGVLSMTDFAANRVIGITVADRLINVDNTIRGSGQLGANFSNVTNQALVVADQPTSLIIDPPSNGDFTNSGTVRAEGGTIRLEHGPFLNTGGVIEALDGSVVELATTTIDGGTLQTSGSGIIRNVGSSAIDGSTNTVTNAGLLSVANGTSLFVVGTLQNTGTLQLSSTAQTTDLRPAGGEVFLTGGGVVTMSNTAANRIIGSLSSDRLINVDNTIRGSGQICANFFNVTNQALIVADQPTTLVIDPPSGGDFTNTGTVRADGGTLRLENGLLHNTGGVIEALDGSVVEINTTTIDGGTFQTVGSGVVRNVGTSVIDGSSEVLTNAGTFDLRNATTLFLTGTLNNTGTIQLSSIGQLTDFRAAGGDAFLTGGGQILISNLSTNRMLGLAAADRIVNVDNTIRGAGQICANFSGFTNQGTLIADQTTAITIDPPVSFDFLNEGVMQASGPGGISILTGPFENFGAVIVDAGSVINRTGVYFQTGGSTIVNGVLNANGDVDIQGGILGGTGTINDGIFNAGTVSPGESTGVLTIDDVFAQAATGEILIEIGGAPASSQFDRLVITGAATLDGVLRVDFVDGYIPVVGHEFTVMSYASRSGNFTAFDAPCLPAGRFVQVDVGPTAVKVIISGALVGDADCDCAISPLDIEAFLLALLDPTTYLATYANCTGLTAADMNGDSLVDGRDVQPFVDAYLP